MRVEIPDLLGLQKTPYLEFLQKDTHPEGRKKSGLEELFQKVFPVESEDGLLSLEYVHYILEDPVECVEECIERKTTYESLTYASEKHKKNPRAGFMNVDLINEGSFIESFRLNKPNQNKYKWGATDKKRNTLVGMYGEGIMGLKQESFEKITGLKIYLLEKLKSEVGEKVEILSSGKIKSANVKNHDKDTYRQLQYFVHSSPHINLLHIPLILGEEMVLRLDARGIAVSTASACSIIEGSGSNLLKALGKHEEAKETVRVSFSHTDTFEEIDIFVQNLKEIVEKYQTVLD